MLMVRAGIIIFLQLNYCFSDIGAITGLLLSCHHFVQARWTTFFISCCKCWMVSSCHEHMSIPSSDMSDRGW